MEQGLIGFKSNPVGRWRALAYPMSKLRIGISEE